MQEMGQWMDGFLWPDADARQRAKRERILQSATELFVRFGYRKTSMDEVARRAGIAKGTVYLYYRNKAELVFHAVALEERTFLVRLEPLLEPSLSAPDRLVSLIALVLIAARELPLLARFTGGDRDIELAMQDIDTSVLSEINHWQVEFTGRLLEDATGGEWLQEELRQRAQVLVNLMFAVSSSVHMIHDSLPEQDYAWAVADIIVNGILQQDRAVRPLVDVAGQLPEKQVRQAPQQGAT